MLMSSGNSMRPACVNISIFVAPQSDTTEFHTLKVTLSVVDTKGFVYDEGCVAVEKTWNYVIQK
jgi:hypothetical protein